jgi:lipopolysaccharide transport system permease protein
VPSLRYAAVEGSTTLTAPVRTGPAPRVRRIRPSRGLVPLDFHELWAYRALLYLFTWRDVKTRYRQTFLSGFWAIFRPVASMVLFSVIFGGLAGIEPGNGVPYPLFVYPGVLVWTYFASAAGSGVSSIASNGSLISKAYFPRLYAPIAVVTAPLVDFVLSFTVLLGLFGWYHRAPSWHIVFVPLFLLIPVLLSLSISLWLTGAAVKYRDVGFGVPFVLQLWMYATPVIYPASLVPDQYAWLLALNPMTAAVEGFRWSLLGSGFPSATALAVGVAVIVVLLASGVFVFRRSERTFADLI